MLQFLREAQVKYTQQRPAIHGNYTERELAKLKLANKIPPLLMTLSPGCFFRTAGFKTAPQNPDTPAPMP